MSKLTGHRAVITGGGTGIGLAIVRQAIERHDGRIWVESAEGEGASFCFSIPIRAPAPHSVPA